MAGVFDSEVLAVDEVEEVGGVVAGWEVLVCVCARSGVNVDGDLRRLVAGVVDGVAKGCVAIGNSRFEELFEAVGEGLGPACKVYHVVNIMVGVEGVRPGYVLIERICRNH